MVPDTGGPGHLLHRNEGTNQGYPLSMITHGIGVLLLIRKLRDAQPQVTQPWYADDYNARGHSATLQAHCFRVQTNAGKTGKMKVKISYVKYSTH